MIRATQTIDERPVIEVFLETDPRQCEQARLQREQFDRNSAWLQRHISDVYVPENRGKIVCVAGEEAFFGDTLQEAVTRAMAAFNSKSGGFQLTGHVGPGLEVHLVRRLPLKRRVRQARIVLLHVERH